MGLSTRTRNFSEKDTQISRLGEEPTPRSILGGGKRLDSPVVLSSVGSQLQRENQEQKGRAGPEQELERVHAGGDRT